MIHNHFKPVDRKYLYSAKVAQGEIDVDNYETPSDDVWMDPNQPDGANLITSLTTNDLHAPVIDFDCPIEVYPSSRLGHFHLYINKEISWIHYLSILYDLASAGIVEMGYYSASLNKGFSAVRPPGIIKQGAPKGVEVLRENSLLRKQNYDLRAERDYLLEQVKALQEQADAQASKIQTLEFY